MQAVLPALAAEWQLTESTVSLAVSVATGALAVSVLPWAAVADRIGRARAMTISAVVAAVAGLLVPLAPSFAVLLTLRGDLRARARRAAGAGDGAPGRAGQPPAGRRPSVASTSPGTTIGGLAGRVLTGAVGGAAGWRWGLATTAVLVVVATVGLRRAAAAAAAPSPGSRAGPTGRRGRIRLALSDRTVWVFYAQAFLLMGGFVTVYNLLGVPAAGRSRTGCRRRWSACCS